jgi:hypothetical protein
LSKGCSRGKSGSKHDCILKSDLILLAQITDAPVVAHAMSGTAPVPVAPERSRKLRLAPQPIISIAT